MDQSHSTGEPWQASPPPSRVGGAFATARLDRAPNRRGAGLTWQDVRFAERTLRARGAGVETTKGHRRVVPRGQAGGTGSGHLTPAMTLRYAQRVGVANREAEAVQALLKSC